jgi:hypothetical protein
MRRSAFVVAIAGSVIAACGGDALHPKTDCGTFRFSPRVWAPPEAADAPEGKRSRRQRLADGLVACNMLDGKTKPQVHALLGPPRGSGWSYVVGPDRRDGGQIRIASERLIVEFSPAGVVLNARLAP